MQKNLRMRLEKEILRGRREHFPEWRRFLPLVRDLKLHHSQWLMPRAKKLEKLLGRYRT